MSELKMSDADVGEMIAMCVESKLAGFDSVSVDPLHVVEMDSYYQSIIDKQTEQINTLKKQLLKPMQPIVNFRFKENKIVRYCLENNTDLNDIAMRDFSTEDMEQFAQLIGCSLSGYAELSYVTDESYCRAMELAEVESDDK